MADLVEAKKKNLQEILNPNSFTAIKSYPRLPQLTISRKIRAANKRGGSYHVKTFRTIKPITNSEEEQDEDEKFKGGEENEKEESDDEEEVKTKVKSNNKTEKLGYKKNAHQAKKAKGRVKQTEDYDEDGSEDSDGEKGGSNMNTSSQNFMHLLFTSLKKFLPFTKQNRGSYVESSLPLDITYRMNDELETQLAHVTICVKDDLTTSNYNH